MLTFLSDKKNKEKNCLKMYNLIKKLDSENKILLLSKKIQISVGEVMS